MTILAGRNFTEQDNQMGAPVVVMGNETFARHFWGTNNPVGKRIRRPGARDSSGLFNTWFQVVGLLRDERHDGLDQKATPTVFLPLVEAIRATDANDGRALREISFVLRSSGDPAALSGTARNLAHQLNSNVPIDRIQTLEERLDTSLWARLRRYRVADRMPQDELSSAIAGPIYKITKRCFTE